MKCMWEWDYKCLLGTKIWTLTCNTLRFLKFALTNLVQFDCSNCKCLVGVAVCCSVLKCVAVCCSVLQWVAVCCSVLQMSRWYSLCLFLTSLIFTLTHVTHYDFSDLHSNMWLIIIPQTTKVSRVLPSSLPDIWEITLTYVTHYNFSNLHWNMWLIMINESHIWV